MKLKNKIIFISALAFAFSVQSCGEENEKVPDYVLEKEKFTEILKDKAIAESVLNLNIGNYNGTAFDSAYNFNVLKQYNVTKAQFDTTMKYYASKPEKFKEIMESVLEDLNVEKAKK